MFWAWLALPLLAAAQGALDVKPATISAEALHIPRLERGPTLEDFAGMKPSSQLAAQMRRIDRFIQRNPTDGAPVSQRTEAYLAYTDKNLYVVFLCFDTEPGKLRAHLNRREDIQSDDQIGLFIDTFDDRHHAYAFFVNPVGIQQDSIYTEENGPDMSFDTLWRSSAHITPEGYVAWFEIPFKSMRFPRTGSQRWGVFIERDIPRNNEASFYPRISSNIQGFMNQEAQMDGMENISPGRNMQFIPYGSFRGFRALDERDPAGARFSQRRAEMRAGLDTKIVLKDSLVLDATVNPDFAQVESDEPQTTVNQRFEVFFPEKRPFFIENASYFDTPISLVFTRRIADPTYGVRLTGKVGHWAIGTLFADDRSPGKSVIESDPLSGRVAHFGVVRINRDIGKNSTVGMIYTDRELNTSPLTSCGSSRCTNGFNRIGGFDARLKFSQKWVAQFQAVTSSTKWSDGSRQAGPSYNVWVQRSSKNMEANTLYQDTAPGFVTLTGFFRRPDVRRWSNFWAYRFYTKKAKKLVWHGPSVFALGLWDHSNLRGEYYENINYRFVFKRQTAFGVYENVGHERLRPQDFSTLTRNQDYGHNQKGFFAGTQLWSQVDFNTEINWGADTNYNPRSGPPIVANSNSVFTTLTVRPVKGLTVDNRYILYRLGDRVTGRNIFNSHIIRSKWNYQFTRELSLRFIGQYSTVLANPLLTTLQSTKIFNADVLVTYLLHPGTAVYVGYNSNLQNLDPSLAGTPDGLLRTQSRFMNDGRQIFVKVSYLFRY